MYSEYAKEAFDVELHEWKCTKIPEKESERKGFVSLEELKAFIAFNEIEERSIKIFPVKVERAFSDTAYATAHCTSPYKRS